MPIYDFCCNNCENQFDDLVTMGENGENVKCPKCGSVGAKKLFSGSVALMGLPNTGANQSGGVRQIVPHRDESKAAADKVMRGRKPTGRVIDLDK